jgi:hypothetical protein
MTDLFHLKFDGYCSRYQYGIMPVSDYDFMATHVCITVKEGNELIPISGFKSINSEICKDFRVPFPAINCKFGMFTDNFPKHVEALKLWEQEAAKNNEVYAYNGSWTMKTDLPKVLRDITRELSFVLFCLHYNSMNIKHVMNSASANFGVNKHQEWMGMEYLADKSGILLPSFKSPVFFDEPFYLMHLRKVGFSQELKQAAEKYQNLWEKRIIVKDREAEITRKAA